jgi:hypothetical protein
MNDADLLQIFVRGEDSRHQFKRDETNADSITMKLAVFANSGGGLLLPGVGDNGRVTGLDATDVRRLNQLISNAASQNVCPPIHSISDLLGSVLHDARHLDNEDICGALLEQYQRTWPPSSAICGMCRRCAVKSAE